MGIFTDKVRKLADKTRAFATDRPGIFTAGCMMLALFIAGVVYSALLLNKSSSRTDGGPVLKPVAEAAPGYRDSDFEEETDWRIPNDVSEDTPVDVEVNPDALAIEMTDPYTKEAVTVSELLDMENRLNIETFEDGCNTVASLEIIEGDFLAEFLEEHHEELEEVHADIFDCLIVKVNTDSPSSKLMEDVARIHSLMSGVVSLRSDLNDYIIYEEGDDACSVIVEHDGKLIECFGSTYAEATRHMMEEEDPYEGQY